MVRVRKIIVRLGMGIIGVLAAACVAAAGLYAAMQTESGRAWIAQMAERALSEPDGRQVTIQGLSGTLPQAVRLDRLEIRDTDGAWLTASSLVLDWRPWRLLLGEVSVTHLSIGEIAVARLLAGDGQAAGLPLMNLEIREFAIGKVALASPVLGTEAAFTASGYANVRPGHAIDVYFDAERSDGQLGTFQAEAAYRPVDDHLILNFQVHESEGGIIAHLLDQPALPSVQISGQGEGPISRWRGQLAATATDIAEVQAEATLSRDAAIRWDIIGDATIDSVEGTALLPLIAGRHAFRLSGSWAAGDRLAIETLRSSGDSLSVDGHARWDIARDRVSAWLSGRVDRTIPFAIDDDIALSGPMALEVAAEGSTRAPSIRLQATAARLALGERGFTGVAFNGDLQLRLGRDSNLQGFGFNFSAKAAGSDFDGTMQAILGGPLALEGEGFADLAQDKIDLHRAELKAGSVALTAKGQLDLSSGEGQGDLALTVADLSQLSSITGVVMRGRMSASGSVTLNGAGTQMTLDVSGNLSDMSLEEPALQALLGEDVRFHGDISVNPDGLWVSDLFVDTAHAFVNGGLTLTDSFSRISAEYNVVLPDAAIMNTTLGVEAIGRAEAVGRIEGTGADPYLDGVFSLDRIGSEGVFIDALSIDYRVESLASASHGRLEGKAEWRNVPVRLTTGFRFHNEDMILDGLRIDSRGAAVQGTLTVPTGGEPLRGALTLRAETLQPWLALTSLKGDGSLSGEIKLSNEKGRQGAVLDATVESARLSPPDSVPISAERLKLSARTHDLYALTSVDLFVHGTELDVDELRLASISINGEGNLSGADFRLQAKGKWIEGLSAEASGRLSVAEKEMALDLQRLDGTALGEPFALRSPLHLAWSNERIVASGADIAVGTGWLRGSLDVGPQRVGLDAEADGLSLAPIRIFNPTVPMGLLSGSVRVSGPRHQPEGTLSIQLADIRLPDMPEQSEVELLLDGRWHDGRLGLDGKLKGAFPEDGILSAELPLRLAPTGFSIELPETEPVSGTLRWQGDIAGVWALVPVAEHRLAGPAKLDLSLTGSVAAPQLRGSVVLANGQYESVVSGTLMRRLNAEIAMDGNELRLARFDAEDGDRGKITADGSLALDPGRGYPFQLNVHLRDFYVARRDDVDGTASGDIIFEGNRSDSRVHGKLKTERVEVRLLDRLPPGVVHLDVVEVRDDEPSAQDRSEPGTAPLFDPALDIAVSLPRRVFVRGRGLDSEWEGNLQVAGSIGQPRVTGQLNLVRGFMAVVGKTFRLSRGTVTFPPGETAIPRLNVAAAYNMTGYTVTVSAEGPVTAPTIKLSSAPSLPQDEIVSRVLFDKSTTRLTPAEAVQLAAAMSDLAGVGAGGVMDFARRTLGVDVLRVEDSEVNGGSVPAVSAGKYLTDRVYVDVKQGATPESGAVGVEVELTPNISLDSEMKRSGASNFGVKFKYDY